MEHLIKNSKKKHAVIQKINDMLFSAANAEHSLDLEIKVCHLTIFGRVINFSEGKLIADSSFNVDLLCGDVDTVVTFTESQMERALLEVIKK